MSAAHDHAQAGADSIVAWLIGPVLLVCAGWFLWGSEPDGVPSTEQVSFDRDLLANEPRPIQTAPAVLEVAGFEKHCMECHALFRLDRRQPLILSQHRNIVQAHGMNDRCRNCHAGDDPSHLQLPGGEVLPLGEAGLLCATCHGTTYRDWERGMHGRTTGSWDRLRDDHHRLLCTECHDPHAPAFGPMQTLPPPNALRQGDGLPAAPRHEGKRNPLRQWSGGAGKDSH